MLSKFKIALAAKYEYFVSRNKINQFDSNGKPRLFLIDTPSHGNLGDHAIALAELNYFADYFPNYKTFEVCEDDFNTSILAIKKCIQPDDIIVLSGGGNLGEKYILDEKIRRKTISKIKNNRIIIFPQTMDFSNTIKGRIQRFVTKLIYSSHKKLMICVREEKSMAEAQRVFKSSTVVLAPDIALYLKQSRFSIDNTKSNIALFFRNDTERKLTQLETEALLNAINNKASEFGLSILKSDTVVKHQVSPAQRDNELKVLFSAYSDANIVITDRLHGMILAAVSGTYCVVLPNSNHKIRGVYDRWLKDLEYVHFSESLDDAIHHISAIEKNMLHKYKYHGLKKQFDVFYKEIENICKMS